MTNLKLYSIENKSTDTFSLQVITPVELYEISIKGKSIFKSDTVFSKNTLIEQGNTVFAKPAKINDFLILPNEYALITKNKLNTLLFLSPIFDDNEGTKYYTYLNYCQRFRLQWTFKKLCFQKKENIIWFINIIVAIGAVVAAFVNAFKLIK